MLAAMVEVNGDRTLGSGRAFVDLSGWRKIGVSGADSISWLNDLLTADLSDLGPNRSRRALLLSPTARIRADVTVAVPGGSVVLFQDPIQPDPIDGLLARYVLSSDVELDDRTDELCLFALPGRARPPDAPGTAFTTPSVLGDGVDLTALVEDRERLLRSLSKAFGRAEDQDVEAWRVLNGVPRFGIDFSADDLPQEAAATDAVSFGKGCYLGQEAVAKVRNLGHPRRLLLHLRGEAPVERGEALLVDERQVGEVTSSTPSGTGSTVLGQVRWDGRDGPFTSASGVRLEPVGS
jgi:tRNA-modifying protein YgfZ